MKKIFKMAVFHFFQQGTADVLLLRSKLDMSIRNIEYRIIFFLYLSKQLTQNTCNIQFNESFYLEYVKYGIYSLCKVVVDSYLQICSSSSRCVFKVSLKFLSLVNFTNNFHNFIILLNLLKSN